MPINPPLYATDGQTPDVIRNRMLANFRALGLNLNSSEGSLLWAVFNTSAIQLARSADYAIKLRQLTFMQTAIQLGDAATPYLDLGGGQKGIPRLPATAATVVVRFTGAPGTLVGAGTRVSTATVANVPAQAFTTNADVTLNVSGYADVTCTAVTLGSGGNVAPLAIQFLVDIVPGITQVSNPTAATGGTDRESNTVYLARYLRLVQAPPASGSESDYANWALSVAGVGGVAVLASDEPGGPGADKVSIAIIDQSGQPASQALVDAVQDYIAPPWINTTEAENASLTGAGVTVDLTQTDDIGNSVKMVHDAAQGFIRDTIRSVSIAIPQHGGQWDVRPRMKVGGVLGAGNLVTVRVWDDSAGAVAPQYFGGPAASITYTAAQLNAAFTDYLLRYYDNGVDYYHLEIIRETADATTNLWVDRIVYQSEFGQSGKTIAPTGAFVNVISAVPVTINFSVALTITAGYDVNAVRTAVQNAFVSYLQSLALQPNNDVQYARVGTAILNTPGVSDYATLTINGGTANIAIGPQQVAVFGTATWL
jgi:uncharacterized phage protein gp47/JayE